MLEQYEERGEGGDGFTHLKLFFNVFSPFSRHLCAIFLYSISFFLTLPMLMLPFPPMKKLLTFVFVALPLGAVLSIVLAVILAGVTFCRSFADYWAYIIVQFFPLYGQTDPEELQQVEETKTNVWERHIARMESKAKEEESKKN